MTTSPRSILVKLRLGIGYVIQSAGLMPHQRVVDNVATVPAPKGESRRAAPKTALGVLEAGGLDPASPTAIRLSCRVVSSSASASHAHWPPIRRSC